MKINRVVGHVAIACAAMMAAAMPSSEAQAQGKAYTWKGADGGSWQVATNWDDGSGQSTGSPGDTDFAQFTNFSGKVSGAAGAQILDIGPGSELTLEGSGFFSQITVGQDFDGNAGAATLTIRGGNVVAATFLSLGSALGGSGTLNVWDASEFSASGGIVMDQTGLASTIVALDGGKVFDGVSMTMAAGGLIEVDSSSQIVVGNSNGGGNNGALTIADGFVFEGEGSITGNVIVNGTLETFNAGWPVSKLTVTGNVTGTGAVSVVQELDVSGAIGSQVTVSLYSNGGTNKGLLRLAQPTLDLGTLDTMSTGSVIALSGLSYDDVSWSDTDGLTLGGASLTLVLATSGDHSHQTFCVQPDPLSGTDILVDPVVTPSMICGSSQTDSYDASTRELTIPALDIDGVTYSNVVATVSGIVTAPSGTSPNGNKDSYDPASGHLTVQAVTVGSNTYYNAVVTLSALDSIGSASGIDVYNSANNQLTIPSVQVVGGAAYKNVVITVGSLLGVGRGMPAFASDQYTPGNRQLLIPAVQANGKIFTNVLITVKSLVSMSP